MLLPQGLIRAGLLIAVASGLTGATVQAGSLQQAPFIAPIATADSPIAATAPINPSDAISPATPLDVLTSSPDHRILVRLFQRTRLIPTLLRLIEFDDGSGLTILAPTDDSIRAQVAREQASNSSSLWTKAIELLQSENNNGGDDDDDDDDTSQNQSDNIQEHLRQHLLHHILNFTLPYDTTTNLTRSKVFGTHISASQQLPIDAPHMHATLHFPTQRGLHEPSRPGHIPQPPQGPVHPGDEDAGGLLGGEGQKVRMLWQWSDQDGKTEEATARQRTGALLIGVDSKGRDGVRALQEYRTPHGIVVAINGTLALPPSFASVVRTHPSLAGLSSLLTDEALHTLSITAHSTFFLPTTDSFKSLPELAQKYLLRNVSQEEQTEAWRIVEWDRTKLTGWHVSGRGLTDEDGQWGQVAYADRLKAAVDVEGQGQLTTILGGPLHFSYNASEDDASLRVAGHKIIEEDVLTENGVVHIIDSLLLPYPSALSLNVEKTLLALNASRFVTMMRKAGLESYLLVGTDDSDDTYDQPEAGAGNWTFVVPSDDTLKDWLAQNPELNRWWHSIEQEEEEDGAGESAPVQLSDASLATKPAKGMLKDLLKYHIIPDAIMPDELTDGGLVATELRNWRLKEGRQRIVTTVSEGQGSSRKERKGNGDVAFGDANVIAAPVLVGDDKSRAVIYLASKLLTPPDNPIQTAVGASLELSTFVAAVFSAELDKPIKRAPGVTYLVPNNDAFQSLGLVMSYLLLPTEESRNELRKVVEYHSIDEIVYISDFASGEQRYPTLEGSSIWAGKDANGTIEVRRESHLDRDGKLADDRASGRPAKVRAKDLLTSTGVLHEIDQVELPRDMSLTSGKLLKGAKCDTFRDLVIKAGYGFILNGTAPDAEQAAALLSKSGKKKRDKKHKRRHHLFDDNSQSYILLAPTDQAFARINLTRYLSDHEALKRLIQLHILPSPALEDEENLRLADAQTDGGRKKLPLGFKDGVSLPSLLDKALGGQSSYGSIAFRNLATSSTRRRRFSTRSQSQREGGDSGGDHDGGDGGGDEDEDETSLGWMLGVAGSRGASSIVSDDKTMRRARRNDRHSAQVLNFGRESLAMTKGDVEGELKQRERSIGGILTLDSVLIPYEPNWFHRWGWIVLTAMFGLFKGTVFSFAIYKWWKRSHDRKKNNGNMGEAMEGEEE